MKFAWKFERMRASTVPCRYIYISAVQVTREYTRLTRHRRASHSQSTHLSPPVAREPCVHTVCIEYTRFACAPHMGVHDPCRPGQCARTLQPAEQRRAFQLQLQAWLQTPPSRSSWEVAGEIEEVDEESASVTSGEVSSGAARSTW